MKLVISEISTISIISYNYLIKKKTLQKNINNNNNNKDDEKKSSQNKN